MVLCAGNKFCLSSTMILLFVIDNWSSSLVVLLAVGAVLPQSSVETGPILRCRFLHNGSLRLRHNNISGWLLILLILSSSVDNGPLYGRQWPSVLSTRVLHGAVNNDACTVRPCIWISKNRFQSAFILLSTMVLWCCHQWMISLRQIAAVIMEVTPLPWLTDLLCVLAIY
jgi:hypothetical protein